MVNLKLPSNRRDTTGSFVPDNALQPCNYLYANPFTYNVYKKSGCASYISSTDFALSALASGDPFTLNFLAFCRRRYNMKTGVKSMESTADPMATPLPLRSSGPSLKANETPMAQTWPVMFMRTMAPALFCDVRAVRIAQRKKDFP